VKKFLYILLSFCMVLQADEASDLAYQQFKFEIGINLVQQDFIVDWQSTESAMLQAYQDVDNLSQIIDLYLMIDETLQANNITTFQALINFYITPNQEVSQAVTEWLAAYQDLFLTFVALHNYQVSFNDWLADLEQLALLQDDITNNQIDSNYYILLDRFLIEVDALNNLEEVLGL